MLGSGGVLGIGLGIVCLEVLVTPEHSLKHFSQCGFVVACMHDRTHLICLHSMFVYCLEWQHEWASWMCEVKILV